MIKKLRQRFIIIAMVSMCAVLMVIMGIVNILNYQRVLKDADHILGILAENGGTFPDAPGRAGGHRQEERPQGHPEAGTDGKTDIDMKDMSPETPFETRYFTVTLSEEGNPVNMNTGSVAAIDSEDVLEYANEVQKAGKEKGFVEHYRYREKETEEGLLLVFVDCRRSLENFWSFLAASVAVSLAGMLTVLLLVIYFSRMVFAPVVESYHKQKRFITDAGHELKTPLTIIDANVEVLEMENGENEWTDSIRNQTKRLSGLTANLVMLARLDESEQKVPKVDFSLSDAAVEVLEDFKALALAGGKMFSWDITPNLTMHGSEEQVRQLMSILMENALKYSDERGSIEAVVKKRGHARLIIITNTVSEIPAGNLNYLFERFYRADESRSSQTAGYGIGLSIAQSIVSAHKGKIEAKSEDGKSFVITVTFP